MATVNEIISGIESKMEKSVAALRGSGKPACWSCNSLSAGEGYG